MIIDYEKESLQKLLGKYSRGNWENVEKDNKELEGPSYINLRGYKWLLGSTYRMSHSM